MFEIRAICDPSDADRITAVLAQTFTTGAVRQHATRDGKRTRLYVTADYRTAAEEWPTPDRAYATAPGLISEIGWVAEQAVGRPTGALQKRQFWLRKAAVLDRIALEDESAHIRADASELALSAARHLLGIDRGGDGNYGGTPYWPEHPEAIANPRGYVRQEYARWAKHH